MCVRPAELCATPVVRPPAPYPGAFISCFRLWWLRPGRLSLNYLPSPPKQPTSCSVSGGAVWLCQGFGDQFQSCYLSNLFLSPFFFGLTSSRFTREPFYSPNNSSISTASLLPFDTALNPIRSLPRLYCAVISLPAGTFLFLFFNTARKFSRAASMLALDCLSSTAVL